MSDQSWKAYERRLAADVGGRRIPVTGLDRGDRDVEGGLFFYQAKLRRSLPRWIFDWISGICATAATQDRIGVLVLRVPKMRDDDALVVLRWKDWRDLHGKTDRE
jgi:hypothetical protein